MTVTRREFLGGLLAGLGAAIASKLPKAGTPKKSEPIAFGMAVPYQPRTNATFTLRGEYREYAVPGARLSFGWAGEPETTAIITSAVFDGEYTEIVAFT